MLHVSAHWQRTGFGLNVSFELPTPGVIALFGRSGSGKSTVVNIIAGLARPDSGCVRHGQTVLLDTQRGIDLEPERRRIGYVFQDARLFPHLSVEANLRYAARRATGTPFVNLATVIGLLDLSRIMDRRTHQLSGGERQRVAIGRALLTQPCLLLLDEPLAGLDAARRAEVLPYLETLRDHLSVPMVYVTHDFSEVLRLATHVVLLDSGTLVAQGSVAAMSLDPQLRAIVGPDQIGAIIEGTVLGIDPSTRLTRVRAGAGELHVQAAHFAPGSALRIQLLARDIIISTRAPQDLSVRNNLAGLITRIVADDQDSDLVFIDIGAAEVMARITKSATTALALQPGMRAWALVKSVSLRGRAFAAAAAQSPKGAAFRDA